MKIKVPVMTKILQDDKSWKEQLEHGPIGGFTFKNGKKALIYQCGKCGQLCKFNTGLNKHSKKAHGQKDNEAWGWAEGPPVWEELDITEDMIQ